MGRDPLWPKPVGGMAAPPGETEELVIAYLSRRAPGLDIDSIREALSQGAHAASAAEYAADLTGA